MRGLRAAEAAVSGSVREGKVPFSDVIRLHETDDRIDASLKVPDVGRVVTPPGQSCWAPEGGWTPPPPPLNDHDRC